MSKSPDAFRTISEVAEWLDIQAHVLRFWESKFTQVKPVKRAGGRRYYRPTDMLLLGGIQHLLHDKGLSIKEAQALVREEGVQHVQSLSKPLDAEETQDATPPIDARPTSKWVDPDTHQPPASDTPRRPVVDRDPPEEADQPLRKAAPPAPPPFTAPQPVAALDHTDDHAEPPAPDAQSAETPAEEATAATPTAIAPSDHLDAADAPSDPIAQERAAAPADTPQPTAPERPAESDDAVPQSQERPAETPPLATSASSVGHESAESTGIASDAVEDAVDETPLEANAGNTEGQIAMPFERPDAAPRPHDLTEQVPPTVHAVHKPASDVAPDNASTAQQDFFSSSTAAQTEPPADESAQSASPQLSTPPSGPEPSTTAAPKAASSEPSVPTAAPQSAAAPASLPSEDVAPETDMFTSPDAAGETGLSTQRASVAAEDASTDAPAAASESDPEIESPNSAPTAPAPLTSPSVDGERPEPSRTAEDIARAMATMAAIIPGQDPPPAPAVANDDGQTIPPDMPAGDAPDAPIDASEAPNTSEDSVETPLSALDDASDATDLSSENDVGEAATETENTPSDMASPGEFSTDHPDEDENVPDSDPSHAVQELTDDQSPQVAVQPRVVDVPDEPQGTIPAGVLQRLSSVAAQSPAQSAVLSEIIEDLRHFGQQR